MGAMDTLGANLFPLAIAALVLGGLVFTGLGRRRSAALRAGHDQALQREAALKGITYQPVAEAARARGDDEEVPGGLTFTGSAGGVAWRAEVSLDPRLRDGASRARTQWTRITVTAARTAPGTFLLVMRVPGEQRLAIGKAPEGDGLLASLARQAIEAALDLYVGGFFGPAHRALVNVAGSEVLDVLPGHFVLTNDAAAARARLDEGTRRRLQALEVAPAGATVGHGLLWSPDGLVLGCPVALRRPEDVKRAADQVAALERF